MSTIKAAEAVDLLDTIEKKIGQLVQERNKGLIQEVEKGEQAETPTRSVDLISKEIEIAREHFRDLKKILRDSNKVNLIDWNGGIDITYALDLAKDLRTQAAEFASMGVRKKQERATSNRFSVTPGLPTFNIAMYDPESYKQLAEKLERLAKKLSMLIQEKNLQVSVVVPFAGEYMIVD